MTIPDRIRRVIGEECYPFHHEAAIKYAREAIRELERNPPCLRRALNALGHADAEFSATLPVSSMKRVSPFTAIIASLEKRMMKEAKT